MYIRAVAGMRSLAKLSSRVVAGDGAHGKGDWQTGRAGRDVVLSVPVGTVMRASAVPDDEVEEMDPQAAVRKDYEEELLSRLTRHNRLRKATQAPSHGNVLESVDDDVAGDDGTPSTAHAPHTESDLPLDATQGADLESASEPISDTQDQPDYVEEVRDLNSHEVSHDRENHSLDTDLAASIERQIAPENILHEAEETAEYLTDEELTQQAMEAQEKRDTLTSVWRQYPGMGGTVEGSDVPGLDTIGDGDVFDQKAFHLAEERYAIALKRERGAHQPVQSQEIDLSSPTPDDSPGHLIAQGGSGGFGNPFFLMGDNRSPKFATRGNAGQSVRVELEFKSPADIGFVGLPNAGKSSLLRALTGATKDTAKVGNWEFTTLSPNLGVLRVGRDGNVVGTDTDPIFDSSTPQRPTEARDDKSTMESSASEASVDPESEIRLTIADLPGLIQGAAMNRGLGHTFLRHAERCDALVYVLDVGPDRPSPWDDLRTLRGELEGYKPGLSRKIGCVIANKCDALGPASSAHRPPDDIGRESAGAGRLTVGEAKVKLTRLREEVALHPSEVADSVRLVPISAMWRQGMREVAAVLTSLKRG